MKISEGTQRGCSHQQIPDTKCMPWLLIPAKYALETLNISTEDVIMSAAGPLGSGNNC